MDRSAESRTDPQTGDSSLLSIFHKAPVVRLTATTKPPTGGQATRDLPSASRPTLRHSRRTVQNLREAPAPSLAPSDNVPLLGTQTPPNVVLRDDELRGLPALMPKEGWIALCAGNYTSTATPLLPQSFSC